MTDAQLDALLAIFQKRMQRVTDEYLTAMGEQIKEIGRVIPSAETRLIQMRRMRMNVRKIQSKIAAASGEAVEDIARVFEAIAEDNARFAEAFGADPDIAFLSQPLLAQIKATAGEMANLSRTTIDSTLYRDVIDRGVQAAQAGVEDYNSAIRRALREASTEGIRVTYPSGHTRRLDTAVRQNVLDGIRKLNQANMEAIGEKFGADGVEISAHMMCAEDHLPYQGKQYSNEEFARIQATLKRPFGEWNCRHSWSPIILGISRPAYTEEELKQFRENSTEKITIDGKTKTRYEWTQEQRRVETAIRYQQDIATAAKAAGDAELRREARRNISALNNYYQKITEAAKVPDSPERMGTYYGGTGGGLGKNNKAGISIKIDELTPCLRKISTGELVETTVTAISPTRKAFSSWLFNWTQPEKNGYTVYALKAKGDRKIQGLIAMKEEQGYIDVDLVETAPHNNPQNKVYFSGEKEYNGVGGHLFAEACRRSFAAGFDGWIGFTAKTNLIEYYKKELGAIPLFEGSQRMEIRTDAALKLVEKYYGGKV